VNDDPTQQLRRRLEQAERAADHWQHLAEQRRVTYDQLRSHPVISIVLRAAELLLPPARRCRNRLQRPLRAAGRRLRWLGALPRRVGAKERATRLRQQLRQLPDPHPDPRHVSLILVLSAGDPPPDTLLDSLKQHTEHRHVELVIVDNGVTGATRTWIDELDGATVCHMERPGAYAAAASAGAAASDGTVVVVLTNHLQLWSSQWLRRLLTHLDDTTAAVGATIIHPERPLLELTAAADLTVAHQHVTFVPDPKTGTPTPQVAATRTPNPDTARRSVAAVSGALFACTREALEHVGAFDPDLTWDGAALEWCVRAQQSGWQIATAGDVIATDHRPNSSWEPSKEDLQALFRRHGPYLNRRVTLDRLHHTGIWSPAPFQAAIVADTATQRAAAADLSQTLTGPGWGVTTIRARQVRRRRWDLIINMSDRWAPDDGGRPDTTAAALVTTTATWTTERLDSHDLVLTTDGQDLPPTHHKSHHIGEQAGGQLQELLDARIRRARLVLKTAAPDGPAGRSWGDWHLAVGLARALRASGHDTWIATRGQWDHTNHLAADISLQLRGKGVAHRSRGQLHILWLISHPDEVTRAELASADLVLTASRPYSRWLSEHTTSPVGTLLQATDPHRFHPHDPVARYRHPIVFVGSSRGVRRPIIDAALAANLDLVVYGKQWEKQLPARMVGGRWVANDELAAVYSSCNVLLNDHWDDMREHGFVSNRVFDALACGAAIVSDDNPELPTLFGDVVACYQHPAELPTRVAELLDDPERRRDVGERGRRIVLAHHTFNRRSAQLLGAARPLLGRHTAHISDGTRPRLAIADADGQLIERR